MITMIFSMRINECSLRSMRIFCCEERRERGGGEAHTFVLRTLTRVDLEMRRYIIWVTLTACNQQWKGFWLYAL